MYFYPLSILPPMWLRGTTLKLPVKAGLSPKVRLRMDLAQLLADTVGVEYYEEPVDSYIDGTWQIVKSKKSHG
jgi:hypothetical protein